MTRRLLIPLAVTAFVLSAGTAAAVTAGWNTGYNGWWPGGFGYPPVSVAAPGYPCSITVYGPTFNFHGSAWTQNYGGGTSCAGGVGSKTLTVYDQVLAPDGHSWVTITGSTFHGSTTGNPLHVSAKRAAFLGHVYRTVASAKLVVPNGHAGCSLTNTCNQTITLKTISRPLAP